MRCRHSTMVTATAGPCTVPRMTHSGQPCEGCGSPSGLHILSAVSLSVRAHSYAPKECRFPTRVTHFPWEKLSRESESDTRLDGINDDGRHPLREDSRHLLRPAQGIHRFNARSFQRGVGPCQEANQRAHTNSCGSGPRCDNRCPFLNHAHTQEHE